MKLAQVIEDVEFLPPLRRKPYEGWIKDEDVLISREYSQRMYQVVTGDPNAQIGIPLEGFWEPIEDSGCEDDDDSGEEVISSQEDMIVGGGTALLGSFEVDADEPLPQHAVFFPFTEGVEAM